MSALPQTLRHPAAPELPPLYPSGRLLGHYRAFRDDELGLMMDAFRRYGDIVRLRIGFQNVVFVASPDCVKQVLVDQRSSFSKKTRGYNVLRRFLGRGLVTSEGDFWRRQRRIAQPAFHRKRLSSLADTMLVAAGDTARLWGEIADRGESFDVAQDMMRLTLRIAGETLFSYDLSGESNEVGHAVTELMHSFDWAFKEAPAFMGSLPFLPANRRGLRAQRTIDRVVYQIISERRSQDGGPLDLLDMFMNARDEETGESMSDQQLRDEVVTMLSAGHETTANALSWTFYLLSKHPTVLRRVQAEIDEVLGGEAPSFMKLRELTYTSQVFEESMRMFPPVWALARRAEEAVLLGGYHIPKNSYVVMSPYVVHRHPAYWDNPECFDPDRFAPPSQQTSRPSHAYFPFALGPRKCIGSHFTKMEALIILSTLLASYAPILVPGQDIQLKTSVTLRPGRGVQVSLRRRNLPTCTM